MHNLADEEAEDVQCVLRWRTGNTYRVSYGSGPVLEFSISASLSRQLFPVSTDVEFDACGICVVSPHSHSLHFWSISVFIFQKKRN